MAGALPRGLLRFHDLLDQWLDCAPVGIVGDIQLLPIVVQLPLHHLRRIEIAAVATAVPASAATTKAAAVATTKPTTATAIAEAAATVAAAIIVDLRECVAKAQSEGQGHRAHRHHAIQFHNLSLSCLVFLFRSSRLPHLSARLADRG